MSPVEQDDLSQRLGIVEQDLAGLRSGVASIQVDMGRLMSRFDERTKTPWAGIGVLTSVVVTIGLAVGAMYGAGIVDKIRSGDVALGTMIDANTRFHEQAGIARDKRIDDTEEDLHAAIARFDVSLQREMRDLDGGMQAQIDQLRHEADATGGNRFTMQDWENFAAPRIASLDERLNAVEIDRSGLVLAGRHEDVVARVAALERLAQQHTVGLADVSAGIDAVARTLADMRRAGAGD